MPKLSVNGLELHYEDSGSGPPVVFSHGLLWSGRMYAADAATGGLLATLRVGAPVYGGIALAAGTVLAPAWDGRLHAFATGP